MVDLGISRRLEAACMSAIESEAIRGEVRVKFNCSARQCCYHVLYNANAGALVVGIVGSRSAGPSQQVRCNISLDLYVGTIQYLRTDTFPSEPKAQKDEETNTENKPPWERAKQRRRLMETSGQRRNNGTPINY